MTCTVPRGLIVVSCFLFATSCTDKAGAPPEGQFVGVWEYRPGATTVRIEPDAYTLRGLKWHYRGIVPFLTTLDGDEFTATAEYQYRVQRDTVIYRNEATDAEIGRRFEITDADELVIDGKLRFVRIKR